MKIADFFIQITAKGDLKELKMIADAQKAIKEQSKMAIAAAKVKVQQLKKETVEIKEQTKAQAKQPKNLKDMLISALGLNKAFVGIAGSVLLTAIALDKMVTKLAQANQLYTNFQRQTGMSMNSAIGMAGAMANLDISMTPQEIMQNMQNLQSNLIGVQFGMGNIAPYQMAGINPFGINSANMMDVIRKQLKGFAPAYRTFLLQQMGLDPRLGALIDLSDTEYLRYKEEALELYLSPEDRKTIQELTPEWNKVNLKFTKGWDRLVMMLSRDFVGLGKILADLWGTLIDILEVFNTILKPILDMITLVLRPIYLLLDDFIGFLIGKDSIIGRALSGDKEGTKGALGALFGVGSKEVDRLTDAVIDLHKFLEDTILGKTIKTANYMLHPELLITDLLRGKIPNVFNNSDKNLSMNNNVVINANSPSDGFAISNAVTGAFNPIIAQLGWGH